MSAALDKLAEMVLRAEASATSEKLRAEMEEAAALLRSAEQHNGTVQAELQEVRRRCTRELEEAELQQRHLKELIRKTAQFKSHLKEAAEAEDLITLAQQEIDDRSRTAREAIDAAKRLSEEALAHLQAARQRYEQVRAELDRLQPRLAPEFTSEDRLWQKTAVYFPAGELWALEKEIKDIGRHYGTLSTREQYAQMKVWIGRQRRLMTMELSEEEKLQARGVFPTLVGISKEYEPGYIEAFQQDHTADWDVYIAEAEEELRQATEIGRQRRAAQQQQREQQLREEEQRARARESAQRALEELQQVIARFDLPHEGQSEFRSALSGVIAGYGASDPEILQLVLPHREIIAEGNEFRALRRNLERLLAQRNGSDQLLDEKDALLVEATRGRKAVLIGGTRREDLRLHLLELFEFDQLNWEDFQERRPAKLKSLEQSVKCRGMDLVLILGGAISHAVSEKLRPLCEQHEIPCVTVEHGYGTAQVTQALRRGLLGQ